MQTFPPSLTVDRPHSGIHFRLVVEGWHPIIAMRQPNRETCWEALWKLGIRQVLRLSEESQPYNPAPLKMLGLVALEDQYETDMPSTEAKEELQVIAAVQLLRSGLRDSGVAIHCVGGRGRTGTVIGGFLHTLGFSRASIIGLLDAAYKDAGRPGWPESQWQGEVIGRTPVIH